MEPRNVIDWQPGQEGKGLILEDGTVHVFDTDEYGVHDNYVEAKGLGPDIVRFLVEMDGQVQNATIGGFAPWAIQAIEEADPHLYVKGNGSFDWETVDTDWLQ